MQYHAQTLALNSTCIECKTLYKSHSELCAVPHTAHLRQFSLLWNMKAYCEYVVESPVVRSKDSEGGSISLFWMVHNASVCVFVCELTHSKVMNTVIRLSLLVTKSVRLYFQFPIWATYMPRPLTQCQFTWLVHVQSISNDIIYSYWTLHKYIYMIQKLYMHIIAKAPVCTS